MGRCTFNNAWPSKPEYRGWLERFKGDATKALCSACNKVFDVGAMGESALKSHARGMKHVAASASLTKKSTITGFLEPRSLDSLARYDDSPSDSLNCLTVPNPPPLQDNMASPVANRTECAVTQSPNMMAHVSKNDVLRSEVLWTLKTVTNHQSYRSTDGCDKLFQTMFPDSAIAKKLTCNAKKCSYLTVFGLGEHIKTTLLREISGPFVLMFDESLNRKSQSKQMDVHVRLWDVNNQVSTRYFDSVFLGKKIF